MQTRHFEIDQQTKNTAFSFFTLLRNSGVANMWGASIFALCGKGGIKKFIKTNCQGYVLDKALVKNLLNAADPIAFAIGETAMENLVKYEGIQRDEKESLYYSLCSEIASSLESEWMEWINENP
jgi:hypothetical protein